MTILDYVASLPDDAKQMVSPIQISSALGIEYARTKKDLDWHAQTGQCKKVPTIICPVCGLMMHRGRTVREGATIPDKCVGCDRDVDLTHEDVVYVYDFTAR